MAARDTGTEQLIKEAAKKLFLPKASCTPLCKTLQMPLVSVEPHCIIISGQETS